MVNATCPHCGALITPDVFRVDPTKLTAKELRVVELIAQHGMKNREAAAELRTTEQVVKNCLVRIFLKLGVRTRLELAMAWKNPMVQEGATHAANSN